jgi:hypothetical protein
MEFLILMAGCSGEGVRKEENDAEAAVKEKEQASSEWDVSEGIKRMS